MRCKAFLRPDNSSPSDDGDMGELRLLWAKLMPAERRTAKTIPPHLPDLKPDIVKTIVGAVPSAGKNH